MPEPDAGIAALPPLREVIAAHGLSARKGLGQHFLLDLNLTGRIARAAAPLDGATVIEVGPGPGGLTRALLSAGAARVIAIEKDRRCRAALQPLETAARGRLTVVDADALEVDEAALVRTAGGTPEAVRVVSNLPYNVATPLIVKWLRRIAGQPDFYAALVLTLQREVAARLLAAPRTKAYGRLSVMCQWLAGVARCFDIGPRAFTPPPRVTSTVVGITPHPAPRAPAAWRDMEDICRAAFGQRRKMLRTSLGALGTAGGARGLLEAAGIDPDTRAEALTVEEFCALARALAAARGA